MASLAQKFTVWLGGLEKGEREKEKKEKKGKRKKEKKGEKKKTGKAKKNKEKEVSKRGRGGLPDGSKN